jgi:hypothetical protein
VGRTVKRESARRFLVTLALAKRLAGSTPALSATAEGTAEWLATGPENQGMVMNHGRSIRLPSANFAQVVSPAETARP